MKKILLATVLTSCALVCQAKVTTFKYAPTVETSKRFSVKVEGKTQTVLATMEPDVCIFDCDSPVTVKVEWSKPASRVDVRPLSLDFSHKFKNGVLTLTMKPKDRVVVEFDGDTHKPLFLFANAIDKNKPSPKDPKVHYYKAGKIYEEENLNLKSGETLYIEGGAILRGNIKTKGADNIRLAGSGVFDSRRYAPRAMFLNRCNNVEIKDLTLFNRQSWCLLIVCSNNIDIDNFKVIGEYNDKHKRGLENDALDLLSSSHANIRHCLTYCHDDAYCIKTGVFGYNGESNDISYEDCIAWNVRGGNSFEIGYAISQDISNVSYRNMYSIHKRENDRGTRNSDISIHCAGKGVVRNVSYENIFLEETDNYTIHFCIFDNGNCEKLYGYPYTPGGIENVSLKNVHVLYEQPKGSVLRGYDGNHKVKNVTIENMVIQGKKATDLTESKFNISNSEIKLL